MLLEVVQVHYRKVDKFQRDVCDFDSWMEVGISWEDWPNEVKYYAGPFDLALPGYPMKEGDLGFTQLIYVDFQEEWAGIQIQAFSESGIYHEIEGSTPRDVFEDFLPILKTEGERVLAEYNKSFGPDDHRQEANFLALFSFTSSQDYDGEWSTEVDYVGIIDQKNLKLSLKEDSSQSQEILCNV